MGLSKPIIIATESVDISNLATKEDLSMLGGGGVKIKSVQRGATGCSNGSYKASTRISAVSKYAILASAYAPGTGRGVGCSARMDGTTLLELFFELDQMPTSEGMYWCYWTVIEFE